MTDSYPADTLADMARWLLARADRLRTHPAGGEAVEEICSAVDGVWRVIDRPLDAELHGPCAHVDPDSGEKCGGYLYAKRGATWVRCRVCGTEHDSAERRDWMIRNVEDRLERPAEIARLLRFLQIPIGYSTVAAYVADKRIMAKGRNRDNEPLFRVGDVLDLRLGSKRHAEQQAS